MPTDPQRTPADPGDAYRDPAAPGDRYTYKPTEGDPWPWEHVRDGKLHDWLRPDELPDGLVPAESENPS